MYQQCKRTACFYYHSRARDWGWAQKEGPYPSVFLEVDGQGPKTMGWMLLKDLLPLDG